MRKFLLTGGAAISFLAMVGTSANAQSPTNAAVRDPQTLTALDRMGASLRRLQSFAVHADTTEERVLANGQKVQIGGSVDIKAALPSGLRVDQASDRKVRSYYFDGRTVTVYSPRLGFYGSAPASGTIRQAVASVAEMYDIETPLADLFAWGENPALVQRVTSAFYVGAETIGGIACDHYAMRQEGVDWQVWTRQQGEALPCKLVITSTDDPSMPQYSAVFTWSLNQRHAASTFQFAPPKGSQKIELGKAPPISAIAE
jgi:hypothetical protein